MNEFFDLVRERPIQAFWLGVGMLIALGIVCNLIGSIVRFIVQGFTGIPPEIKVSCPHNCSCSSEDEEDDE